MQEWANTVCDDCGTACDPITDYNESGYDDHGIDLCTYYSLQFKSGDFEAEYNCKD